MSTLNLMEPYELCSGFTECCQNRGPRLQVDHVWKGGVWQPLEETMWLPSVDFISEYYVTVMYTSGNSTTKLFHYNTDNIIQLALPQRLAFYI